MHLRWQIRGRRGHSYLGYQGKFYENMGFDLATWR